ncbi:hypothetical protein AWC38_SpisGene22414 [Stylophora pistillata]|uniref:Retrotransposon gag domain-containing protein n=1 Tax=Stylophora pistillata TaxID=50429 RepID=A0A2B4RAV5_STYPI|nr:hypothetical protein AWC38_SpisGene22414 [Stylophora pistillata]
MIGSLKLWATTDAAITQANSFHFFEDCSLPIKSLMPSTTRHSVLKTEAAVKRPGKREKAHPNRFFRNYQPSLDKKDALIIYGGKEIARREKSLPNPTDGGNDYKKLKKKLNDYFKPKKSKHHARYVFLKMRPAHDETTNAYAARLREKANDCEFEANCDERILEHLIQITQKRSLIQKAINKKWDLTRCLTEAAQIEETITQISDMKIPQDVKKLGRQFEKWRPPKTNKAVGESDPVDTSDKQIHTGKARTVQHMEKNA